MLGNFVSVAVIMAATHCGLDYGFWENLCPAERKEVRQTERWGKNRK